MSRAGCLEETAQQSAHSPGVVVNEEPVVFALVLDDSANEQSIKIFPNNRLKDKQQSFCRSTHCTFEKMYDHVVKPQLSAPNPLEYKGYLWAPVSEIRSIVAERNNARDKTPDLTPVSVGALCVIDDGEVDYRAHARVGYANPRPTFWRLHDSVAARGNLLLALQRRGKLYEAASPPFPERSRIWHFLAGYFHAFMTSIKKLMFSCFRS